MNITNILSVLLALCIVNCMPVRRSVNYNYEYIIQSAYETIVNSRVKSDKHATHVDIVSLLESDNSTALFMHITCDEYSKLLQIIVSAVPPTDTLIALSYIDNRRNHNKHCM